MKTARPLAERFWARTVKLDGDGCWEFSGRLKDGYGRITPGPGRAAVPAHRVSWEIAFGPVPDGLYVLHRCDNRRCVRPTHLFLGTHADNMQDMDAKGRRDSTHIARLNVERPKRGTANGRSVLTEATVRVIRTRHAAGGVRMSELAREYGVSDVAVSLAIRRVTWRHVE